MDGPNINDDRYSTRASENHRAVAKNADGCRRFSLTCYCVSLYVVTCVIQSVSGDCSGGVTVLTATETTQEFISPNYPHGYGNNLDCKWRLQATNSSHAVRMNLLDVHIENHADCVYDAASVFDGYNSSSTSLGMFCGTSLKHYISTGQYMTLTFHSDYSLSGKGFRAEYYSGEYASLQDPEDDSSSLNLNMIIAFSVSGVVFIAIVTAVIFTYVQAKKAKAIRNGRVRTTHVLPYDHHGEYIGPPAPPAYGEIYASPMSPPPAYCEFDPNPNPHAPLPARSEFINPEAGEGLVSVTPIYASGQTDAIINTRFIRPLNVRNSSSQTPPVDQLVFPGNSNGAAQQSGQNAGAHVIQNSRQSTANNEATSALQVLSPRALQGQTNAQSRAQSRAQPSDMVSLPNAVMSDESQISSVGSRPASRIPTVGANQTRALLNTQGSTVPQSGNQPARTNGRQGRNNVTNNANNNVRNNVTNNVRNNVRNNVTNNVSNNAGASNQ